MKTTISLPAYLSKPAFLLWLLLTAGLTTGLICAQQSSHQRATPPLADEALLQRGAYLVGIMGCEDCHSPKQMGAQGPELVMDRRFSGYPADRVVGKVDVSVIKNGWSVFSPDLTVAIGPWGASFAANISSDATGIGNWSEAQFKKALTQGKFKGMDNTRMLLPPMPWPNFKALKDEDLKAIFAYLKSTKPVKNVVPAPKQLKDL